MQKKLSVLLLEDIAQLGRAGDIVEVAEAYARNALFPQGKAALATAQVKTAKEMQDAAKRKKAEEELLQTQAVAERIDNTELSIAVTVNEENEPYGSITSKTIADLLKEQAQVEVTPKKITGSFPIKSLGSFPISVQLAQGVEFHMNIIVTKKDE
ncbi:MAG TPA: 50S ribosomal protein L9 [Candidatus Andersenbacteria bacterium]|nr:50S ribosomal protein L9 [Candidatus Andersenbacteria bacterium]